MECGQLGNGLRWSAYSTASTESFKQSMVIEDASISDGQSAVNDNYLITFPDDESDVDPDASDLKNPHYTCEEIQNDNAEKLVNRSYDNPLFIPASQVLKDEISDVDSEELMKSKAKKLEDYKFCEAVNDFDIELEAGEAVPIVYLSSSRAARLQRALRLAGYKKVGPVHFPFKVLISLALYDEFIEWSKLRDERTKGILDYFPLVIISPLRVHVFLILGRYFKINSKYFNR